MANKAIIGRLMQLHTDTLQYIEVTAVDRMATPQTGGLIRGNSTNALHLRNTS